MSADLLHSRTLDLLRTISTVDVYDDGVPDSVATDVDGRAYPYVVLWLDGGLRPVESRELDGSQSTDLRWVARLTVASGDSTWTLRALSLVRAALDGKILLPRSAPLEEDPTVVDVPFLTDREVSPARHYVPLTYVTTTG